MPSLPLPLLFQLPRDVSLEGIDLAFDRLERCETWHHIGDPGEPGFGTGWSNTSTGVGGISDAAFLRTNSGLVVLKGQVTKNIASAQGTAEQIFVMPPGYRTRATRSFITYKSTLPISMALVQLQGSAQGSVDYLVNTGAEGVVNVHLTGVVFPAEL